MTTNIRLRRSDNPGSVPQALLFGEVAINYNDGKLFYKNTSNEIVAVKLIRDIVGQSNQIGVAESNGVISLSLNNTVNIDTLNLSRLFVDNIEIDTTSSQIDQILQFNGTKYVPVNPGSVSISLSLDDLTDTVISSPISGQKLFYNGSSWVNEIESTGEPIGHTNKAQSLMSFDKTTRTFSISPVATSFEVWCAGKRFTFTTTQSVQIPNTSGLYYIYFSSLGVLSQKTTFFTWDADAPTAYVYWNATDGEAYFFADERHGITLDWQTHEYLHRTRGAAYASGFSIGAYTITGTGSANADMQLDIADGTFFDEDLQVDITHSASPTANTWQQVLQGGAEIPIFYRSGSVWKRTTPTKYPLKQGTLAQYNLNTAGTWSTPDLATNKYGVTWIVATNNLNYPVIGIMGQNQYDNLNKVAEADWAGQDLTNLPIFEIRPLWKVSYLVSSGFTNTPKAAIREVVDLRVVGSTATGLPVTPTDHGSLFGLSDDDHTQYFDQTRGDARYLQLTGGTVTGTVAATTFSGSGASLTSIPNSATTATNANTASAIVSRDASGNFTAGTITAALSGNASTASALQTSRNINGVPFNGSSDITISVVGASLAPALVATTASGTLATSFANGQSIDGVTLATGNRILIKNQGTASENGIYTVNASGAPTRAADANSSAALAGSMVSIQSGTANGGRQFATTFKSTDTLGTTAMNWFEVFNANTALPAVSLTGTIDTARISGSYTGITGIGTITNSPTFMSTGTITASPVTGLQVLNSTAGNDAFLTFHVSGDTAAYLGMGGAENDLVWGGFSYGSNRYRVYHSGNTSLWSSLSPTFNGLTVNTTTTINANVNSGGTSNQAGFFAYDRNSPYTTYVGLYCTSTVGRIYHSGYGNIASFNSNSWTFPVISEFSLAGTPTGDGAGVIRASSDGTRTGITIKSASATAGNDFFMAFYDTANGSSAVGSIFSPASSSTTTYSTTSDYRLKRDDAPLTGSLDRIMGLRPISYRWKFPDSPLEEGFFAHEVQEIVPCAAFGETDAEDGEGNIIPQQIELSRLVPVLVGAVQELNARITELEARQ